MFCATFYPFLNWPNLGETQHFWSIINFIFVYLRGYGDTQRNISEHSNASKTGAKRVHMLRQILKLPEPPRLTGPLFWPGLIHWLEVVKKPTPPFFSHLATALYGNTNFEAALYGTGSERRLIWKVTDTFWIFVCGTLRPPQARKFCA